MRCACVLAHSAQSKNVRSRARGMQLFMFLFVHFAGHIPTEIGYLDCLTSLGLEHNLLVGTYAQCGIHPYIHPCAHVRAGASRQRILLTFSLLVRRSGPMPTEFGLLTSLTSLKLSSNGLTGTIGLGVLGITSCVAAESDNAVAVHRPHPHRDRRTDITDDVLGV